MAEENDIQKLEEYRRYLERLAENRSTDMFSNGGIKHTSVLISVFLQSTNSIARVYSYGVKSEWMPTDSKWYGLTDYLNYPKHKLLLLVENPNCIDDEMLRIIKESRSCNKDTIQIRQISEKGKQMIVDKLGQDSCYFAVFDNDKFRFEYEPENFKSFGSFNKPDDCKILIELFDSVFIASPPLCAIN